MISKVTTPNKPTMSTAWLKGSGFIRSSRCMCRAFLMVAPEIKLISEPLVFRPALLASFSSRSAETHTLKTTSLRKQLARTNGQVNKTPRQRSMSVMRYDNLRSRLLDCQCYDAPVSRLTIPHVVPTRVNRGAENANHQGCS